MVWARDEFDPAGAVVPRRVEAVFVRTAVILHLHVGGEVIRTTAEHPFFVAGKGWVPAGQLEPGDLLASHGDAWTAVEEIFDTGEWEAVYNLRVEEFHTYFVGGDDWGFSVWAHNANYAVVKRPGMQEQLIKNKKGGRTPIHGTPQNTSGKANDPHAAAIDKKAKELAASGEYEYIVVNRAWRTAVGKDISPSRNRPDIIAVRKDGKVEAYERPSQGDKLPVLQKRMDDVLGTMTGVLGTGHIM